MEPKPGTIAVVKLFIWNAAFILKTPEIMMMPYLHNSCITEGYIYDTDTYVQTMI